jgi:hypothetical protein
MPNEELKDYMPQKAGIAHGAKGNEVKRLQRYLKKFGYLEAAPDDAYAPLRAAARAPQAKEGTFDDATLAALRRFQRFTGLPVTGEVDDATVAQMTKPRCGFPDIPSGGPTGAGAGLTSGGAGLTGGAVEPSGFTLVGCRWPRTNLTYSFQNFTADLTEAQARSAIVSAFRLWREAAPLTFTEAATADIVIRFVAGNHGDGSPFDGPSGVLAHAFYPPTCGGSLAGDTHFDEAETWTVALPVPAGGIDLVTVAAHEFGHALGLAHSTVPGSLMYPYYGGAQRYLSADDVLGIQTLYGARTRAVPGWFGWEDQGADIAIADISGNGRPDLVVFHVDNPGGDNHGYYRIGWNLDRFGRVTGGWSAVMPVPGWFGWENQGAGIAITDINGNGRPDLVVFHVDNPSGDNHGYYRIGWNLDTAGNVSGGWSGVHPVPGWFGWENQGAGIAVWDINNSGRKDLVVFHLDNPGGDNHGYYRIGWNLDNAGNVSGGWSGVTAVPGWFGWENQGAGIAIADINRNGRPDLLVFHLDNPGGENHGYYRVGSNLDLAGNVTGGWGPIVALPGWFGAEDQGAGVALADINGTGRQDLVVFHVDNPGGDNHGYYRVITDL